MAGTVIVHKNSCAAVKVFGMDVTALEEMLEGGLRSCVVEEDKKLFCKLYFKQHACAW